MNDAVEVTEHQLQRQRYHDWLMQQGLRFGFGDEIPALADRIHNGVQNDTPPEALWPRMLPTVRLVESIREKFGPTVIHSAYRSREYNAAVAKSTDSRHSHNDALDFSCAEGTPEEWLAELKKMRAAGVFHGGLGVYATFVHVDTRGYNAEWRG